MPFKRVSTTLKAEDFDLGNVKEGLEIYLSNLKTANLADISIQSGKTRLSLDVIGWKYSRRFGVGMTTRLDDKEITQFCQKVPAFLDKTSNDEDYGGNLDFLVSRSLGESKEQISFNVNFMPGYELPNKNIKRSHGGNTFVGVAYYPEGYLGRPVDGYYLQDRKDLIESEDLAKYMQLAGEVRRLGFNAGIIRPEEIDSQEKAPKIKKCMTQVCINPLQMGGEELAEFTRSMLQRNETKNLTITDVLRKEKDKVKETIYEFKSSVLPSSNNVDLAIVGALKGYEEISGILARSLDLFGVQFKKEDKLSYYKYYDVEHETLGTLKSGVGKGAKIVGKAIATPFIFAGKGIARVANAAKDRWKDYQFNKGRETRELVEELRAYGITPNAKRAKWCYTAWNRECVRENIQRRKETEKVQPPQSN